MNHLQKWTRGLKSKEFSTDDQIRVAVILWLSMPACQQISNEQDQHDN